MKIGFVVAGNISKLAGLEKHVIELANALCKNDKYDIYFIAHKDYQKYLHHKITYIEVDLNVSRLNLGIYFKLQSIFYKNKFDIIHAQASKASFIVSKLIQFNQYTKFVTTIHNQKSKTSFFNLFHHVIGVSNQVLHTIQQEKTVIYNGISLENNPIEKINLKQYLTIKNDWPMVVAVGRLVYAKGFDILLKAVQHLNINLIIVGDGPLRNELQKLSVNLRITQKIFFIGFQNNAKSFINSADLILISSRNEGFPYVFVESILLKKPIIATKISDIDMFLPSQALVSVENEQELTSAIEFFLNNTEVSYQNYKHFFIFAEHKLTLDNMAYETSQVYKKLLGEID